MLVTFCGHSRVAHAKKVETWLIEVVEDLIDEGAAHFYLGGYGDFDALALKVVRSFKKVHPNIETIYVKAYLDCDPWNVDWYDGTIYPPIENGFPRLAITRRNKWMAEVADVVVTYIHHEDTGGAAAMWKHAKGHKKRIIRCPFTTETTGGTYD